MVVCNPDLFEPTPRTQIKRIPNRGVYDKKTVYAILDEALYCHIGFAVEGQPYVIPTIHVRINDHLYIHGAPASRMLHTLNEGVPACITVTHIDGLVLARSAFHHSMNYRSVIALGTLTPVTDPDEKSHIFNALVEHIAPGRNTDARPPSNNERNGTALMSMPLTEVSAKIRTGPPVDDEEDYTLPVWAGVLPLTKNTRRSTTPCAMPFAKANCKTATACPPPAAWRIVTVYRVAPSPSSTTCSGPTATSTPTREAAPMSLTKHPNRHHKKPPQKPFPSPPRANV